MIKLVMMMKEHDKRTRILVSGLLNVETTAAVRGFPIQYYPIDYPFFGVDSAVSGVGYNLAKALATLGDQVELVSYLGRDAEGKRILEQLREDAIPTGRISSGLRRTPVSVVLYEPQGRRQIYCDLKDIQEQKLDPADFEETLRGCDIAALCNINFNRALIREARRMGVVTATDVHVLGSVEDDYNRDFMECADILFLSDEALPCAPADFLRRLYRRYHNRVIVLGMGERGAMLLDARREEPLIVPAWSAGPVVNTVGAGDALFSAFLHYYAKGVDAEAALRRAVVFAGVKIGYNGASKGFCTERELEARLEEGQV